MVGCPLEVAGDEGQVRRHVDLRRVPDHLGDEAPADAVVLGVHDVVPDAQRFRQVHVPGVEGDEAVPDHGMDVLVHLTDVLDLRQ